MIRWVMIEYKIPTYLHSPLTHTVTHSLVHTYTITWYGAFILVIRIW
jgi:hypothetical protein